MGERIRILVCSDLHYACDLEKKRVDFELNAAANPFQKALLRWYRKHIWLRDPFAHNHLQESLGKLRSRFPEKVLATFGDHELGKISLCGGKGGLRLASLEAAQRELSLNPLWTHRLGRYLLLGITSSLAAMPVYLRETLESEREQWREIARQHLHGISAVFDALAPTDRVLLFCHDPTALPYLWEMEAVRKRAGQIERTIIGHLHSTLVFNQSRILSGMPRITFLGNAIRRMSVALSRAKHWRPFNVILCPSLAGLQWNRSGGFYEVTLDSDGSAPAEFHLHPIQW
jgi:hypothetical protein